MSGTQGHSRAQQRRLKFERGVRSFKHKVVWVTGASTGIGREIVYLLAAMQAYVIVTARRQEALEELIAACGGDERVRALPYDLQHIDGLTELVYMAEQIFGPIDVVIHAAGVSQRAQAAETSPGVMRQIMAVNYQAPATITSLLLPGMLDRGAGTVVAVSSLAAYLPTPQRSSYTAAKRALHGFFESLRLELRDSPIRVVMAVPGFVRTEISVRALTGSGASHGEVDRGQARGMDPQKCARKIVRAVLAGRDVVEIGFGIRGRFALLLKSLAPGLLARRLAKGAGN